MSPFLTIVTGIYRRPQMLRRCIASVQAQSDPDYQHVFLTGDESGIDGFHRRLGDGQHRYSGRYIYILPDDDLLVDNEFIAGLKQICAGRDPDVVMVRADKLELGILPGGAGWGHQPVLGNVDILNYAVRAEMWKRHSASFTRTEYPYYGGAYAGDCSFIRDVFASGATVWWWDRLVARSQRISRGAPE